MFALRNKLIIAICLSALSMALLPFPLCGAESGGFGIGPGMVMVQNIKPGAGEIDASGGAGFTFEVENGTASPQFFTLSTRTAKSTMSSWEMGYENLTELSWLRLDKTEMELAAKSKGPLKFFVNIPDKPEFYNRKWMAVVACSPGKATKGASSVGLIVAARIQIETIAKDDTDGANAGDTALIPSSWMMSDARPGDSWRKVFKIRNNTKDVHTYTLKHIEDLEPDAKKYDRYFGMEFTKILKESWVTAGDQSFTLKPGEVKDLKLSVSVSKTAVPGKLYEELVFLQDEKKNINFLRLRTELLAATAAGTK